jgi:hypothetical protein
LLWREENRNDVRKMETLFLFLSNSREFAKGNSFLQTVIFWTGNAWFKYLGFCGKTTVQRWVIL